VSDNPYRDQPDTAFWSRAVARNFDPSALWEDAGFQFTHQDRFMSAGSCFASNVRRYLEAANYTYTVTETPHPMWPECREAPYYEAFSARYGNIYTVRQMVQLVERAVGTFRPNEEFWTEGNTFIDPFRPALLHRARSLEEFRSLTAQHLRAVIAAISQSTALIFTLGLTECWVSAKDGAAFPACPGTVAGAFDPDVHRFTNFTVSDVRGDLLRLVDLVRSINPSLRIVLTVSPVPLVATATGQHVLTATTYSKSVLRVAADEVRRERDDVCYFPAYELVTGSQIAGGAFESDLRTVREPVVATVMESFLAALMDRPYSQAKLNHEIITPQTSHNKARRVRDAAIVSFQAECEEMFADDER